MEEIVRLGVQTEPAEQVAIRRMADVGGQVAERVGPCHVQPQQHVQRVLAVSRLERVHGVARRIVRNQDRNAPNHREGAALAAEDAGFDAIPAAVERRVLYDRQAGAAERTPQQFEGLDQHAGSPRSSRNVRPDAPPAARR